MSTPRRKRLGRTGYTAPRPWQPMREAELIIPQTTLDAAKTDPAVARVLEEAAEVWRNDKYHAIVRRFTEGENTGAVQSLSIRRDDRKPASDWRDLQRIKNDIAGPEIEAINLHPAESRLVDTANQTWLWCMPPGITLPLGFTKRVVTDEPDPRFPDSKQRPL